MTDIIMVGSGGCMREIVWQISEDNMIEKRWNIIGYVDIQPPKSDNGLKVGKCYIPYLGDDNFILYSPKQMNLVLSVGDAVLRSKIVKKYMQNPKLHFPNIILKSAYVCEDLQIGKGCIITMDARVSTNVKMGDFVFMNTGSMICHDGLIGNYVTFSPRSQVAGAVTIGDNTEIGLNASIIQCLKVGKNVTIGAGAVVIRNIEDSCTVAGVPARKVGY